MLNKTKIYQILTFSFMCLSIILLLILGITAVQKSMKLNIAMKMGPSILCAIYVNDYVNPIFDNVNSKIGDGVTLTANTLKLNSTSTFGQSFNLKIENKNENAIYVTFSGATIADSTSFTTVIGANRVSSEMSLSSAGTVTITMLQVVQVTTNVAQCTYTTDASSRIVEVDGKKYMPLGGELKQTFTSNTGYSTPPTLSVTMGGQSTSAYTYTNGILTISNATRDIVVNASCSAITYQIAYNANGGSGEQMPNSNHTYDVSANLTANSYTAPDGMLFAGWATSADGEVVYGDGALIINLATTANTTVPLYAVWENIQVFVQLTVDLTTGGFYKDDYRVIIVATNDPGFSYSFDEGTTYTKGPNYANYFYLEPTLETTENKIYDLQVPVGAKVVVGALKLGTYAAFGDNYYGWGGATVSNNITDLVSHSGHFTNHDEVCISFTMPEDAAEVALPMNGYYAAPPTDW